jgi:arylsulfatase A-like enzyme/tetratricopeptide (TPR) repeat protein
MSAESFAIIPEPFDWIIRHYWGNSALQLKAVRAVVVIAAVMSCIGCSRGEPSVIRVPDGTPIVLISVDTLRSDRLPAYGYGGVDTPAIDRLRHDGILFERAYTHIPLTLPAHTSLLTGLLPPAHGVRDNLGYTVDAAATPLLQQTLKESGYATGAGVSAYVLRRATGISAGFDFYDDNIEISSDPSGPGVQAIQRPGAQTLDVVRPWLRSVADQPFFLFFHIFEPHSPYEPPAEYAARYPSAYDGEVAAADEVVGDLLDELRDLEVYEKTMIVFLSDHGESLGDHGEAEHGLFLYRSTLQVPMILKLPRGERAGETVEYPVQLIDVNPTLVSALGLELGEHTRGAPLLSRLRPEPDDNPIYAETFFPRLHFGWSDLAALIVGRHHFIDAPQPELYDLLQDPDEMNNMVEREPALEADLRTMLSAYDRKLVSPAPVDPETRSRLEALGYVGGASTSDGDVLPDPKTRVESLADIRRAYDLYTAGDLEAAVPAFRKILEENPKIETAWEYLVMAQLGLGRPDEAVATCKAAVEEMPESKRLALRAALLLEHLGRLDDAFVYANIAIPFDPPAAHVLLAQIAFKRGDLEGAEMEAREAFSGGDRRPDARLVLADVFIARGDPQEAIDLLSSTLDEGITADSVYAKLAITYVWIGEFDRAEEVLRGFEETDDLGLLLAYGRLALSRELWGEARGWLERALLADPSNPTIKLNLGNIAMVEGRLSEAEGLLKEAVATNPGSFEGWNTLGMVFARQRDAEGAITAWERAHAINPEVIGVLFHLGLAHAQAGNLSQAIGYFEQFAARAEPGPQRQQALTMAQRMRTRVSQSR